jgi:hypothetical protein
LIDRLDWIGGWPVVRAGRYASDDPQRAPQTPRLADAFESGISSAWQRDAGFVVASGPDGKFARHTASDCRPAALTSRAGLGRDVLVRAPTPAARPASRSAAAATGGPPRSR